MHLFIQGLKGGMFGKKPQQTLLIPVVEMILALAQGTQQPPVVLDLRGDLPGQFHKMMDNDAHHMKAVRHDFGPRKVGSHHPAVGAGEVDADHPNLVPALQAAQEPAQFALAAPGEPVRKFVCGS